MRYLMPNAPEELRQRVLELLPGFTPGQMVRARPSPKAAQMSLSGHELALENSKRATPPWSGGPHPQDISGPVMNGIVEELVLDGDPLIPATFVRPEGAGPFPAVLYCHAHGGDHRLGRRELLDSSRFLQEPGYGPALATMGFASLCIDMTGFGERQWEGGESAIAKSLAWWGKSLFALMLDDLSKALGYLASRSDVDAGRIYTVGLSMGAAHAYWLAALDDRVAGCAHLCMLADIEPMIGTGAHDGHGPYLTVPGLLQVAETGDIAGLIAPRPQLVGHGTRDHLTPEAARVSAMRRLIDAYDEAGTPGALVSMVDPEAGHGESAPMRVAVLDFLARVSAPNRTNFEG